MIKIALKHLIYETCINVFFDKISVNFFNNINDKMFKIGDKFAYINTKRTYVKENRECHRYGKYEDITITNITSSEVYTLLTATYDNSFDSSGNHRYILIYTYQIIGLKRK